MHYPMLSVFMISGKETDSFASITEFLQNIQNTNRICFISSLLCLLLKQKPGHDVCVKKYPKLSSLFTEIKENYLHFFLPLKITKEARTLLHDSCMASVIIYCKF